MRRCRFSIGSASPDEHHKNGRFKSEEGETRQDLKMPVISLRRLPLALSCSRHAVYRCLSAVLKAAFSHTTPDTRFRLDSSLQAGLCARTPRSARLLRPFR